MAKAKMRKPQTGLEQAVAQWLRKRGQDYADGAAGAYRDLEYGGCQSGVVGHLVYYHDTVAFYERHKTEINVMLYEMLFSTGLSVSELFGDKWDAADPLALETPNQNLLAWFGFEEAARRLMEDAD